MLKERHTKTFKELAQAQVMFECQMKQAGIDRFNKAQERAAEGGAESETAWNNKIVMESVESLKDVIQAYLDYYNGRRGKPSQSLLFLRLLKPENAAVVTIKTIFDLMSKTDIHITTICERVGRKIEDEVRFAQLEKAAPLYIEEIRKSLNKAKSKSYKHKKGVLSHVEVKLSKQGDVKKWSKWRKQDCIQLGSLLIDMFANHVFFNGEPLIYKATICTEAQRGKVNQATQLRMTDSALEWIAAFKENVEGLNPAYAPCVIRPRPWKFCADAKEAVGGYLVPEIAETLHMIRGRKSQRERNTDTQCPEVYKGLNILQGAAYAVSQEVLVVANHVFSNRLPLAMPDYEPLKAPASPVPHELSDLGGKDLFEAMTKKEQQAFMIWKEEATEVATKEQQRKSDIVKISKVLAEAKKYNQFESLFFVYSLDFRSRVYAQGNLLTPQGEDLQKALLRFSEGCKLGKTGYKWLAFQGANVYGNDKVSIEDRVSFVEDMTETIMQIAANPLECREWIKADKPWQFLNWCFEWADLQKWLKAGNKVQDFVSYLPIANDGSCSGIQHYSAILKDPVGGKSVNLVPSPLPNDIYGDVAKVLIGKLNDIVAEGGEDAEMAKQWLAIEGGITRGLCKQPVMTTPYGSTQTAARQTCKEYLQDLQSKSNKKALAAEKDFTPVHGFGKDLKPALNFLVPLLWESVGEVVKAARLAMDYIKQISKRVSSNNWHLEWCTPTGFIVEQKIFETKTRNIDTQMFGRTMMIMREPTTKIDGRKMQTSAAPNFIHSMDASHLLKTVNLMYSRGIKDIAVIHDSFGTYAGQTELLRECLVESFVDMYETHNVLEELMEWNEDIFMTDLEVTVPDQLGLDLNVILESVYCFA
jgi:DNA-directed RNA polymerase